MLAEFLLTPQAIVEDVNGTGLAKIQELAICLFPKRSTPVALLCELGNDWKTIVAKEILRITNQNHRTAAMSLFTKIISSHMYVKRPTGPVLPATEADWITSGQASNSIVPLDGIITTSSISKRKLNCTVNDFISDVFWDDYKNPQIVGRDSKSQERNLRALCTHSDWLLIRLPQIRGGSDDEIVTVKQIIDLATQLPSGFSKSEIELHVCMHPKIQERSLINSIRGELQSYKSQGVTIRLTVWPEKHLINRELMGGVFTQISPTSRVPKPYWWFTMTHVAYGKTPAAPDGSNSWNLFSRDDAINRYQEINQSQHLSTQVL